MAVLGSLLLSLAAGVLLIWWLAEARNDAQDWWIREMCSETSMVKHRQVGSGVECPTKPTLPEGVMPGGD